MGWSIADHVRSDLAVDALQMATWRRRPQAGRVVHSDRGSQYTPWVFGHRLRDAGLLGSMARVASSADNLRIESFWVTVQRELLDTRAWETPEELSAGIFEWIEAWYIPAAATPDWGGSAPSTTRSTGIGSTRQSLPFHRRPRGGMITTPPGCLEGRSAPSRSCRTPWCSSPGRWQPCVSTLHGSLAARSAATGWRLSCGHTLSHGRGLAFKSDPLAPSVKRAPESYGCLVAMIMSLLTVIVAPVELNVAVDRDGSRRCTVAGDREPSAVRGLWPRMSCL